MTERALTGAEVARAFHEAYERLAPSFGYETRPESAVPWEQVPENNRRLMIAVASEVTAALRARLAEVEGRLSRIAGTCDGAGIPAEWPEDPDQPDAPREVNEVGRVLWMRVRLADAERERDEAVQRARLAEAELVEV